MVTDRKRNENERGFSKRKKVIVTDCKNRCDRNIVERDKQASCQVGQPQWSSARDRSQRKQPTINSNDEKRKNLDVSDDGVKDLSNFKIASSFPR